MAYWILQANPARYRLADALTEAARVASWTITRRRDEIAAGDRFALWSTGRQAGVYALGVVMAGAEFRSDDDPYWTDPADGLESAWRVGIRIEQVLPDPILRAELAGDSVFSAASIIRMPGGGNPFPLSQVEWDAMESRLSRTVGPMPRRSLATVGAGTAALRQPSHQALGWTREEDILALDLFVRAGVVNGGSFLSESDPRVTALSEELRALPTHPEIARDGRFRNPSGVALKLMNFRAVEKAVKLARGVPGADQLPGGMPRYAALDRAIFEEYYGNDFQGLAADAETVRGGVQPGRASLATIAEDRPVEDAGTPTYETAGAEGGSRSRSEHDLVRRYAEWLAAGGVQVVSRLYRVAGLARPFLCDAYLPDRNALVEAKSSDRREVIRMAVGQLMDYAYLQATQPKLGVLLPGQPAPEIRDLLGHLGIAAIWPFGDGFRDSAAGVFTRR